MWQQSYDPAGSPLLSTLLAALPVIVLLGALGVFKLQAHWAALLGLGAALGIAIFVFHMPATMAGQSALLGALYGLLPIGWIVINVIFLYKLTYSTGRFQILQDSIAGVTNDRRLQLLLVAFCFGAFFEGTSGFGTPVAVTGAILIGLGFSPLAASALSLIANTAPVAFGALGTPILALQAATGLDLNQLSIMIGRQLPFFSFILPFWLIWAFAGFRRMLEIWPALLVAGAAFAVPQYLVSNFHGPTLVDVVASLASIGALAALLKVWRPRSIMLGMTKDGEFVSPEEAERRMVRHTHSRAEVLSAWTPWVILAVTAFVVGIAAGQGLVESLIKPAISHPRIAQSRAAHATGGGECQTRSGGVCAFVAFGVGQRDFRGGYHRGVCHAHQRQPRASDLLGDFVHRALFLVNHRGDAGAGLHHPLFGIGCHHGSGVCALRRVLPVFRNAARLVGRGAHRIGYVFQHFVRQFAAHHRPAVGIKSAADGGGK